MTYETGTFRPPYRRGEFRLVDTASEGTYWHSPDGFVVRMASGECERVACAAAPAWANVAAMLLLRLARH